LRELKSMLIFKRITAVLREGGTTFLIKKFFMRFTARRDKNFFFHSMPRGWPEGTLQLISADSGSKDVPIAERIIAAFSKASEQEKLHSKRGSYRDAWDDNRSEYHGDLLRILESGDPRRLADYLSTMHQQKATYGVSGNITQYQQLKRSSYSRKKEVAEIKDVLVSFAEALDILPYEATVPYVAKNNIYVDTNSLMEKIEKKLGIEIAPPPVEGGLFKLSVKKGALDLRDLWSLYAAWVIHKALGANQESVAEIGGGLGKVSVYALRFAFKDYSLFDLPIMNVMTAWHLIKALPSENILLYGESDKKEAIRVLPYWEFPVKKYALVLNQDSFPEMAQEIIEDYLKKIKISSRYFLSINHEHQAPLFPGADQRNLVVPAIVKTMEGFQRVQRFPYWLRKGYVEELYKIDS